jgi:hypothetical protein
VKYVLFLCAQVLAGNKNAILTLSEAALGTNKYYLVYMAPMPYNYSSLKVNFTLAVLLIGEVSWIEGPPSELLVLRESLKEALELFSTYSSSSGSALLDGRPAPPPRDCTMLWVREEAALLVL